MTFVGIGLAVIILAIVLFWLVGSHSLPSADDAETRALEGAGTRETSGEGSESEVIDTPFDFEGEDTGPVTSQAGRLSSISDLAGGIAHEINNPIAIMVEEAGWIEDLLSEEEFAASPNLEEFKRAVQVIKTQGKRCREITHNLLSFARKTSAKVEDVALNALLSEVVRSAEKRAGAASVKLVMEFDEAITMVRISPSEMQQIVLNLINNAIDAMEGKGGNIRVSSRLEGEAIALDVSDTGTGIPKEILDRIFDPFFTTKPVGKGTGLGLSICLGLVEKMGGTIAVDSRMGEGTTFRIKIPLKAGEKLAPPAPVEEDAPEASGATAPVVLLIDDEAPFVEALSKRLARRGIEVHTALTAVEGLSRLEHHRNIDVVLLDVKMPGMGGLQALKEVKKRQPLTEVILLSGHTTVESVIDGMKLGAFDYLLKPCDLSQLLPQIQRARTRKRQQEERILEARIKEITMRRI